MAFGADFEPDTDNGGSKRINCHCPLTRRSSSQGRYMHRYFDIPIMSNSFHSSCQINKF